MICNHAFVRINDASKPRSNQGVSWNGMIEGAVAGCLNCGQVRSVYISGLVEILHEGGNPIDEETSHDNTSGTPA